jgi:hypothetical protein
LFFATPPTSFEFRAAAGSPKQAPRLKNSTPDPRRFPPPWSVEETEPCFIVRDANGHALAYVYFEGELGRHAAAKLLARDEARRIAANIAKLLGLEAAGHFLRLSLGQHIGQQAYVARNTMPNWGGLNEDEGHRGGATEASDLAGHANGRRVYGNALHHRP